tara:strand:+ start:200 stop:664 length:465 start_codon:yes stop_codon:yes gene_type:complete
MSSTKGIHRPGEVLTGNTTFYTAYSLVDITDTGDSDPKGNTVSFQQAQNLNSLIQALSLRTQLVLSSITSSDVDLSDYEFGSLFTGTHKVWVFKFASEAQDVFAKREDKMFFATEDTHGVPIHDSLTETASIESFFNTMSDVNKNMYFKYSDSL